jgi:AraC-like DNA-binding protein
MLRLYGIYDLFLAMGIGWSLYGILNILSRPNRRDKDTATALALILCFTIPIIDHLLKPTPRTISSYLPFLLITRNIYYLIGPVLWLYARTMLTKNPLSRKWVLLHCIPFITWIIVSFLYREHLFALNTRMPRGDFANILPMLRSSGSFISAIIYGVYVLYMIGNHMKGVQDFYSSKTIRNTLSWLKILILFMIGIYTLFLLSEVFNFKFRIPFIKNSAQVLSIAPIIFIFFFSYFSKDQQIPEDTKSGFKPEKYTKSALEESVIEKINIDLLELVETQKTYLNPELTIDDIAGRLNTTKHNVSQVINIKTENNFYYFINNFRIKEFQMMIKENRFPDYTVIAIAFECGFNSSSVFYSMFKKVTEMTPKEYIKSQKIQF